jgi:hypothetical protein
MACTVLSENFGAYHAGHIDHVPPIRIARGNQIRVRRIRKVGPVSSVVAGSLMHFDSV